MVLNSSSSKAPSHSEIDRFNNLISKVTQGKVPLFQVISSPDSLGCYFTYQPQSGKNDAHRNCISNIRHEGLSYEEATHKLLYLMLEADKRQLSGVNLKDESDNGESALSSSPTNLLLETSSH